MQILSNTKSVCPVCKRVIDAEIFEENGEVKIRKTCPEHGEFIDKYWEDYELYKKMMKYAFDGPGVENPQLPELSGVNCPFDCGLCRLHMSHPLLVNMVLTNRCHLSCWYCFFYAKEGEPIYEPSIEQIEKMLRMLRSLKPVAPNAIQYTGGEPTLRKDLVEIIQLTKKLGFTHIQLNTTGINLMDKEYTKKLKDAGVNVLYMSFDGVDKNINTKNHWEVPYILESARYAKLGIVLVPTVINTWNDHELGNIINFALNNVDIVRAVNFQPVSLVGRMPREQREKFRITIPGAIKKIEEQTNGAISKEDWYAIPFVGAVSKFVEALRNKPTFEFSAHPACGMATYVFLDEDKVIPITRFIDVEGLIKLLDSSADEMFGKPSWERKLIAAKAALEVRKYIDKEKAPKSINFEKLLANILVKHSYSALGAFHVKTLFLGMMHFMDEYNYDIERVKRCVIHYVQPDGTEVPFCTFNVFPEIYRDKVQEAYSYSPEEWKKLNPGWSYDKDKYHRNIEKLESGEAYKKTYFNIKRYW
jgi:uncharacterized radical SAM superfamily Fe-S cluster-containing enzyme